MYRHITIPQSKIKRFLTAPFAQGGLLVRTKTTRQDFPAGHVLGYNIEKTGDKNMGKMVTDRTVNVFRQFS